VVGSGDRLLFSEYADISVAQPIECLRAGDFVDEVPVYVNDVHTPFYGRYDVRIPNFVKDCFSHGYQAAE
jgi:hypothetical protein